MPIIAIASDHGGLAMKEILIKELRVKNIEVLDLGTDTEESVDYPDYAKKVVSSITEDRADMGILVCGTGIGMSIAANRHPRIRAALVHDAFTTRMAREHNNANVLVLGGRTMGDEVAKECLEIFLNTEFAGGRHYIRVDKMSQNLS